MIDLEIKEATASQDYDCATCGDLIPDETQYMRVARVEQRGTGRRGRPSALAAYGVEHHHPECWRMFGHPELR